MRNPDLIEQKKNEIMQEMNVALESGDEKEFASTFMKFADHLQESIVKDAEDVVQSVDTNVLASRGVRQLTSKESEFYQKTIEAMKSPNPKQALTNLDVVMPETIIGAVFEDLEQEHPLLSAIDFTNTTGITKMLFNKHDKQLATWDALGTAIVEELTSGFELVDMTLSKLSAFIPVSKDMLDLGPNWLDRYVRTILGEAIAFGLEEAIINGTGKNMPIGMNRDVSEDVSVSGGVYPEKAPVPVTSLDPKAFGELLATLSETPNGNPRKVSNVLMVVNPTDYLTKVMPATTIRGNDGLYRSDVLPFPTKVVQSVQVPKGKAIIGLGHRYFMGIGTAKSGKIDYSDDYRFLEDERVYLTKLYGHGQALDDNAFIYADISDLDPAVITVKTQSDTPVA